MNYDIKPDVALSIVKDFLSPITSATNFAITPARHTTNRNNREVIRVRFEIKNSSCFTDYKSYLDQILALKFKHWPNATFNNIPLPAFENICVAPIANKTESIYSFLASDGLVLTEFTNVEKEAFQHLFNITYPKDGSIWKYENKAKNIKKLVELYFPTPDATPSQRHATLMDSPIAMWPKAAKALLDFNSKKYGFCGEVASEAAKSYISYVEKMVFGDTIPDGDVNFLKGYFTKV